jgi:hypothetical protein
MTGGYGDEDETGRSTTGNIHVTREHQQNLAGTMKAGQEQIRRDSGRLLV